MVVVMTACGDSRGVPITVTTDAPVATVSERFLSVAIDSAQLVGGFFWDLEGAMGGMERVPPLDLSQPRLRTLAAPLAPAYLRIGGTDADRVFYDLSDTPVATPPARFMYVMTRAMWDGAIDFARALDFRLFFTLNAGAGPRDSDGKWQPDNARTLLAYAAGRADPVDVWELGNEINAYSLLLDVHISPADYARDASAARALIDDTARGKLAAPSSAYWPLIGEVNPTLPGFLAAGGELVDLVTWHFYPQQGRRCPVASRRAGPEVMLDPQNLDEIARWADEVSAEQQRHAPQAEVWLGETGNAQCGGEPGVSDGFVGSLWWLDQLGLLARRGTPVMIRQALVGANYGLLDETTLEPRPDYFASVLWRRLMGPRAFAASAQLPFGDFSLRVYAHCAPAPAPAGALTVLVINLGTEVRTVHFNNLRGPADVYAVSATELSSKQPLLDGVALRVGADGSLPPFPARRVSGPVELAPRSYAFLTFPDADAAACR